GPQFQINTLHTLGIDFLRSIHALLRTPPWNGPVETIPVAPVVVVDVGEGQGSGGTQSSDDEGEEDEGA
ncbi:hypothetical protein HK104_004136, partial [Borealophlyctis nickersoniae]